MLVHGVTGRANQDPLLVHLARSLAALGFRCVVPSLRYLSCFCHDPRDIVTLIEAIDAAAQLSDNVVAVLAFSYGASYALSAAADPRVSTLCSDLVGFGAYYDLSDALEFQRKLLLRNPRIEDDDADLAYLRYTLLACHRAELDLPTEAWKEFDPILVNFTSPRPISQIRSPLLRFARDVDFVGLMHAYQHRNHSKTLSPAGVLSALRCTVGLLHDPDDRFVPPEHVERIRAVLDARPSALPAAVLTTAMLSHVQVNPLRRILDLPRLIAVLEPILGRRPPTTRP